MEFVVNIFLSTLQIYWILLIVRILLSWFQSAEWAGQIIYFLSPITDPYLNIFRSIIPPLGGIDISAILALFLIQFMLQGLQSVAYSLSSSSYALGF
ncbi:MAG: YggT family protein [Cyanobacteria bacterium J06621_8]